MIVQPTLFARLVAHDLRSPITAASEALWLSETAEPEMAEELRDIARQNLTRAEKMVTGLRSFVRAEGEPDFIQRIDVRELVGEVVQDVEFTLEGNDSRVKIRIVEDLGFIFGCKARASHIFRNLIINAIVHNEGLDGLEVKIGRLDAHDAVFFIKDNGRGILSRDHDKIFEPFRRVDRERGDGMGLGLSLVQALVDQDEGKVWVESEIGCGATFWFSWPAPLIDRAGELRAPPAEPICL
jgi:signal transduction histidine kinase